MQKKKVIFMGTPDFSVSVLEGLINHNEVEVIAAVTQPDRPVGRKRVLTAPPVKQLAEAHNIPVYQPEKLGGSEEMTTLLGLEADILITAAYGQFVPTRLLNAPRYGAINVHASLLPKYRGGAPIHYAIWKGEQETGVSIMYMVKEMDAGDVLAHSAIPIEKTDDVGSMFDKLAVLGRELLLDTLPAIFAEEIVAVPQDKSLVTFSPTISKEEEQLNWQQTSIEIDQHVRGFRPFPSTYTWLDEQRVKIWQGKDIDFATEKSFEPGTVVAVKDKQLIVACGEKTYYAISEWQESGKKRMTIETYLIGNAEDDIIGKQFAYKI